LRETKGGQHTLSVKPSQGREDVAEAEEELRLLVVGGVETVSHGLSGQVEGMKFGKLLVVVCLLAPITCRRVRDNFLSVPVPLERFELVKAQGAPKAEMDRLLQAVVLYPLLVWLLGGRGKVDNVLAGDNMEIVQ